MSILRAFALAAGLALAVVGAAGPSPAQDAKAAKKVSPAPAVKAGKGEKVCNYRFPSGERRSWVCKVEEPCCAWDAISYVKCGSTITGCF